jgi:MYXO-CTERM domain-containing protein
LDDRGETPVLFFALFTAAAYAWEPPEHGDLLPFAPESGAEIRATWERQGGWWVSDGRDLEGGGTRVGALVFARDAGALALQARGLGSDGGAGPWAPLTEIWRNDEGHRVLVLDLEDRWPSAQLRLREPARLGSLDWELRVPVGEPRGEPALEPPTVSAALQAIGVIARESWGASTTTCTTTEDDWYRMAIHHTAGSQTSGGTVRGAVQALQAYSMGSGEYCDIPYQFLVGYDGSLWEGRPLTYYSGATGGGNNDGNIALSYLGCYDSSCSSVGPHSVTDAMMAWSRLLVHTLAAEHAFAVNSDTVRGHRDWPGNATACPGDYVVARFDELLSAGSYYQAGFVDQSFPALHEGTLRVPLGGSEAGWFDLRNDGMETWEPGETFLAPIPRDQASAWAGSDWPGSTRAATVGASTAPGQTGRFSFSLAGNELGSGVQYFGLVQEWVTWFADLPYGGGPTDSFLAVSVEVYQPGDTDVPGDSDPPGDTAATDSDEPPGALPPGIRVRNEDPRGCGCAGLAAQSGEPVRAALALLGLLGAVARRRRCRCDHALRVPARSWWRPTVPGACS